MCLSLCVNVCMCEPSPSSLDLTDTSSFERAKFWVNELKTSEEDCTVYLCGTKCDLVAENKTARKVDRHIVEAYREEIGAKDIIETSAKTGHNIGGRLCVCVCSGCVCVCSGCVGV